jgi:hypothetical protein
MTCAQDFRLHVLVEEREVDHGVDVRLHQREELLHDVRVREAVRQEVAELLRHG